MKMTKGKIIILTLIVLLAVIAFINILREKDINAEILKKVTIVTDGKINKDNEGKLVLVTGKINYTVPVSFSELDEDFKTIKITRKVEDYIKHKNKKTKKEKLKWVERKNITEASEGNYLSQIISENKISDIKVGEFTLDQKGIMKLPTDEYYNKKESIEGLTTNGVSYSRDPSEKDLQENDVKLTYKYYDIEKNPYITVLAVQKDNSFIPYEVNEKQKVYKLYVGKIDTKEKLAEKLNNNSQSK